MTNIYWPVYKNLESEMKKLFFMIHVNDEQLKVYSSKISDLILRASSEIESISKELYRFNGGQKTSNIKYDEDAIKYLNNLWKLERKVILISSSNCFQTNKKLTPFVKNEPKTSNGKLTYSWNNSYQNLKHDRGNSLEFGSLKYLFDIMAALFILNLYYKDETVYLGLRKDALNFPGNLGSDIFSVKVHPWKGNAPSGYIKGDDFEECLYYTQMTQEIVNQINTYSQKKKDDELKAFLKHPKYQEYIRTNNINDYSGDNLIWDVLGKDEYLRFVRVVNMQENGQKLLKYLTEAEFEGVLNKNSL